ncbi:omega-hydroxypalmitate O-feruloyl transferase-like [Macadamia integrifolia]|uniref:omega-hydroxypalmitate O-feruloyl transferase-like n=1 Tax=Macadamia integrifolia TaxID=60698 RepID=UPI001C4E50A1|nr:omega-hydroxypalmitate O-feruloyl transferase-like [Macadamia integrifolia]
MEASHGSGEAVFRITKSKPVLVSPTMNTYDGLYYLSPVDEFLIPTAMNMLLRFERDDDDHGMRRTEINICETIKQALAKVLVHYYPFAGRVVMGPDGNIMVKCTGEGVSFVEAVANCELCEFGDFTIPDPPKHRQLVHAWNEYPKNPLDKPPLVVQVTRFQCGGFVVGLLVNHCMCDGASMREFMKSWGEIARGLPLSVVPFLDRSILKPKPKQPFKIEDNPEIISPVVPLNEQSVFKSFCFDLQKLMQLKKIAAMEDETIKGTTTATDFQLIMAFIWRARTKALKMNPSDQSKLFIVLDGRHRFGPSFPKGYFGNALFLAHCECSAGELIERPLWFAVDLMKRALELNFIQSLDDYLENVQSCLDTVKASTTELLLDTAFIGNKWSTFLSNDIDFGCGVLTQIGAPIPQKDLVLVNSHIKGSKNKILTLGLTPSNMKAFEEIMQSEMRIQASI